jgi:hypothetical protein
VVYRQLKVVYDVYMPVEREMNERMNKQQQEYRQALQAWHKLQQQDDSKISAEQYQKAHDRLCNAMEELKAWFTPNLIRVGYTEREIFRMAYFRKNEFYLRAIAYLE